MEQDELKRQVLRLLEAGCITGMVVETSGASSKAKITIEALHRDLLQYPINSKNYDDIPATNPFLPPRPLAELMIEELKKKLP